MNTICIIHYGEIGLKGRNRIIFERQLISNIKKVLVDDNAIVKRQFGRFLIKLDDNSNLNLIKSKLELIFGIENFHFGYKTKQTIDEMSKIALEILKKDNNWQTFRIQTKRSNKNFSMKSEEINRKIGSVCGKAFPNKTVKLKNPDITIYIEIVNKDAFILEKKYKGAGGLPIGSSAPVLALLSGGLDSPVAARQMMKRGCPVHFIHFHSEPYTNRTSTEKVIELAKIANLPEQKAKIILVPIIDIQKSILTECEEKYRVLLYRRAMIKLAEYFAHQLNCKALVTGESVGQVASQTIENITAVHEVTNIPILQPLISLDKKEIIDLAKKIGTFETSILPHEDCCTIFMPKNPSIKTNSHKLKEQEDRFDLNTLLKQSIKDAKILEI